MRSPAMTPLSLEHLKTVPTPALVVDLAAARRNHGRACALLGPKQILRPHFKAHKCTALTRLQLSLGVASVCCQTSWEAVALAKAGVKDIMVTNQIVDDVALAELSEAARLARVSALADCRQHVDLLAAAARRSGTVIDVLVEVDVGMKRCGVAPSSDELIELAAGISASPSLRFLGIQAYDGQVAGIAEPAARRAGAEESAKLTRVAVGRLEAAGFAVAVVAGASTGHMPFIAKLGVWTDIQAGSYLLMDGVYRSYPDLGFETALYALATIIHRSADRVVLDIGLKHLSVDRGNPSWIEDHSAPLRLSDEHTVVTVPTSTTLDVGDRTFVLPRHIDPTVNLHPVLWSRDDDTITECAIDGRMEAREPITVS